MHEETVKIEPLINGPLIIRGKIQILDKEGNYAEKEGTTAFCRCGASKNKPFCDGSHRGVNFVAG